MSDDPNETGASNDDKLVSLLAYVLTPLAPLVILLMEDKRSRPFVRAHNAQALLWGILNFVVVTVSALPVFTLCIGLPVAIILWAIGVYWGIKAYQGEYVNIPVITELTKNQGWA